MEGSGLQHIYKAVAVPSQAANVGSIPITRSTVFKGIFRVGNHRNDGSNATGKTFMVTAGKWFPILKVARSIPTRLNSPVTPNPLIRLFR